MIFVSHYRPISERQATHNRETYIKKNHYSLTGEIADDKMKLKFYKH